MFGAGGDGGGGRHANSAPPPSAAGESTALGRYWVHLRWKAHSLLSDEPPEDETLLTDLPAEPSYMGGLSDIVDLTYTQRLVGFLMVFGMGLVFIAVGTMTWMVPKKFSFFMTCGNIFCLCSTMFLAGCTTQLRVMFEANRFEAACLYIAAVVLTLGSALWLKSSLLALIFAALQVICILWYSLTFIPYARQTLQLVLAYISMIVRPILSVIGQLVSSCIAMLR